MTKYKTPRALEQAVKAAATKSGRNVNRAIKGFYHDRLLCRVFSLAEPAFVLKGGQSMLAKLPDARETKDIDLLGRASDLDKAVEDLKAAAAIDLGDFLEYRFRDVRSIDASQDYREGCAVRFDVWLGGTKEVGTVSVDLVVDPIATDEIEILSPAGRLDVAGLNRRPGGKARPPGRLFGSGRSPFGRLFSSGRPLRIEACFPSTAREVEGLQEGGGCHSGSHTRHSAASRTLSSCGRAFCRYCRK